MDKGLKFLSDLKFYNDYSKYDYFRERKETWDEAVDSVMEMHYDYYADKMTPRLKELMDSATEAYKNKQVLASQRNLQFRGEQILKHPSRLYNCSVTYIDRPRAFSEVLYQLLCGCGVGFSVQFKHVEKLPHLAKRTLGTKTYVVEDSIEGWADAAGVLMSSYFTENQQFPEYAGYVIHFDFSKIREKGAYISGGFKAPGPDGLKLTLEKMEKLIEKMFNEGRTKLKPIEVHDIICHEADAVLSGGVRRSATISIFSLIDDEMRNAKTGNWFIDNPQRARANNSAILIRDKVSKEQFQELMESVKQFGEPGIFWAESEDIMTNPCISKDTIILTTEGPKMVKDLIGKQFTAIVNGKEYPSTELGFFNTGYKKLYRLKTRSEHYLHATGNHKVYTQNGWKEISNLSKEDKIRLNVHGDKINDKFNLYSYRRTLKLEYDDIDSITELGEDYVYDCQIPGLNAFDANGIYTHNCGEIGFIPIDENGESGWSMCNLNEINASACTTKEKFLKACQDAAVLGTLQAGYTKFKYLTQASRNIIEKEALLGVSITGWMANPKLFNEDWLKEGAAMVKRTNEEVASLIRINPAARTTCVKPSGNASAILGTTSGIHGEHSPRYFRIMQLNKNTELAKYLEEKMPELLEESVWSATKSDYVVYVPITANPSSIYKKDLIDEKLLEKVRLVQQTWVEDGTRPERGIAPYIRHNVSNTITVENWDNVIDWIYENKELLAGLSFLPNSGDKIYQQAPFTSVLSMDEIIENYGTGAMFASGLIVDGLHAFDNNLWNACDAIINEQIKLDGTRVSVMIKKDWIRRAKKFAKNYFGGDLSAMVSCLKDVHLFHKWNTINRQFKGVDFTKLDLKPDYVDIDTLGAAACFGGACETL